MNMNIKTYTATIQWRKRPTEKGRKKNPTTDCEQFEPHSHTQVNDGKDIDEAQFIPFILGCVIIENFAHCVQRADRKIRLKNDNFAHFNVMYIRPHFFQTKRILKKKNKHRWIL